MNAAVSSLGYLGIGASDLAAWESYAGEVLGLVCETRDGDLLLRMDDSPWRLCIEASDADDIVYAGFEVASSAVLEALCMRLASLGIAVTAGSDAQRAARGVDQLLCCSDPDGVAIELYCGRAPAAAPFISPRGLDFVTGAQGLGHIVLMAAWPDASKRFYVDGLGFKVSDYITLGRPPRALELTFLHCNARHHTMALVQVPGAPKRLNHIMLQVDSLDDVGSTLDLVRDRKLPISMGLGRHTNDHMVSFYARTPSGFDVEFGYGARTVDDATWSVTWYDSGSSWGHRREGG